MERITFVIPCRSNLPYLQQAIGSIEDHYGNAHDIVILDDASNDGTWDWITKYSEGKDNIITYKNEMGDRVGHTVLYDIGIQIAKTEIVSILHSDMVVTPNYIQNMIKNLQPKKVVSATRIEPPLHPPGPEKYVQNFGLEVSEFLEQKEKFLNFVSEKERENKDKITNGIFAPWMIYKKDFVSIGGHDFLFAPMELEDSDIFNRFYLAGYELIQSRDAFVYHMTCRGSRFKDGIEIEKEIPLSDGTIWYKPKDSKEYLELREDKFREWWRKWHTDVLHDEFMMPRVPKRYDVGFRVTNCNYNVLHVLEPWCDTILIDDEMGVLSSYYWDNNRKKTLYDLKEKIKSTPFQTLENDIIVHIDGKTINNELFNEFIRNLPFIIENTGDVGKFEYKGITVEINRLNEIDMIKPHFKNIF